jgi:hypothetical protein
MDEDLDPRIAARFGELDRLTAPELADRIFGDAGALPPTTSAAAPASVRPAHTAGDSRRSIRRWGPSRLATGLAAAVALLGGGLAIGLVVGRGSDPEGPTMLLPTATSVSAPEPEGYGAATVVPATVAPGTTIEVTPAATVLDVDPDAAPSDATAADIDPLTAALEEIGADVGGAPAGALALDGAIWCGVEQAPAPDPTGTFTDEGRRRCLLDAHLAAAPAVLARVRTTTEGDPIVEVWRTLADGTVQLFADSTRDREGSGRWDTQSCGRLTTGFPGPGVVPTTFGCADDTAVPVVHASEPVPTWFTAREVLPLCGYAIRLDDVDVDQRMCFRQAIEEHQAGEFAYLDIYEGVRTARWFRVTSTGEYEVFVQTITGAAPGSPAPAAVWERHACGVIGTVEGPGDTYDEMPVFRPEDCAAGPDAEPPPTTTTTTRPANQSDATIMASPPPT